VCWGHGVFLLALCLFVSLYDNVTQTHLIVAMLFTNTIAKNLSFFSKFRRKIFLSPIQMGATPVQPLRIKP
jgi:hypothetical protein